MRTRLAAGTLQPRGYRVRLGPPKTKRRRHPADHDERVSNKDEDDEDEEDEDDSFADSDGVSDGDADENMSDSQPMKDQNQDSDDHFPMSSPGGNLIQLHFHRNNPLNRRFQTFEEYLRGLDEVEGKGQQKPQSRQSRPLKRRRSSSDDNLEDQDNNLQDADSDYQSMIRYVSKRPTASFEDESTLTRLRIRAYFPSWKSYYSRDGLRSDYWTENIEREFNRLWVFDKSDLRFRQGPQIHSEELQLWKMMFIRYRRIPSHLFTYGLKLGDDCYEGPGSLMLSSKASLLLQRICSHNLWGDSIDSLRHVLQSVAKDSIEMHPDPIGPHPDTKRFEQTISQESRRVIEGHIGILHYDLWVQNKPDTKPEIHDLISRLHGRIRPNTSKDESKNSLFILTIDMREDFLQVLDQFNRGIYVLGTEESVKHFRYFYGDFLDQVEPRDNEQLVRFKYSLELCELRDIEIRKVMRMSDQDEDFLHDIPHISTTHSYDVPRYHHHQLVDSRILPVLRGEITDPKRAILQKLDKMENSRAQALDEFTIMLAEEVLLDEESEKLEQLDEVDEPFTMGGSSTIGEAVKVDEACKADEARNFGKSSRGREKSKKNLLITVWDKPAKDDETAMEIPIIDDMDGLSEIVPTQGGEQIGNDLSIYVSEFIRLNMSNAEMV